MARGAVSAARMMISDVPRLSVFVAVMPFILSYFFLFPLSRLLPKRKPRGKGRRGDER